MECNGRSSFITSVATRAQSWHEAERNGFKVRFCSSFVFVLLPLMYLSRLRSSGKAAATTSAGHDELALPKVLDRMMEAAMRLDEGLIAAGISLPVGGSLLAVAERVGR